MATLQKVAIPAIVAGGALVYFLRRKATSNFLQGAFSIDLGASVAARAILVNGASGASATVRFQGTVTNRRSEPFRGWVAFAVLTGDSLD